MFIRRTQTRRKDGQTYHTHRLVCSQRDGSKVRQRTLLNLGANFPLPRAHWALLCHRIQSRLHGQADLSAEEIPTGVESEAQRIVERLLHRCAAIPGAGDDADSGSPGGDIQPVDINSLSLTRPRSVGVEQVGLWAMDQLGLRERLAELGISRSLCAAAVASIIGRMAAPASERATHAWLTDASALGELLDVDFSAMTSMQLYRASDALMRHRETIESHLFDRAMALFGLTPTVTLYDLTNRYFEGDALAQTKAQRGHSKEKRSDRPLLTLGLVLDGSGLVRRSKVFAGNVNESATVAEMLSALQAPTRARVILDRGTATQAQLVWLRDNGYRYIVVSRERRRQFNDEAAVTHETRSGGRVHLEKVEDAEGGEVRLYCYSEERAKKEEGMTQRFAKRFEDGLQALHEGLSRPRTRKALDSVWLRIGRLQEKSHGVSQHYEIQVTADQTDRKAVAITWQKKPVTGARVTHPGVYCLRSNETDWDEATLWRTYSLLTDLEAVFRSLKSELGLRPIYHYTARRAEGHLFLTVIAYQLVQGIRSHLAARGKGGLHTASWTTLRRTLGTRQRVTATFRRADGRTLHVRKATQAEPAQQAILDALGIAPGTDGGLRKILV